jgi:Tol biopolymer transport system component
MNKRKLSIGISLFAMLVSILSCNAPLPTVTEVPAISEDESGSIVITDTPEIPVPSSTTLRVVYIKGGNVWLWTEGMGNSQLTYTGVDNTPILSGDGQEIAFLRNGELWVVNADGSAQRQLVSSAFLSTLTTGSDIVEVKDFVWKPGAQTIYFNSLVVAGEAGYRIPQVDLYRINTDGGVDAVIMEESPGSGGVPSFSPDGSVIALVQPDKIKFLVVMDSSSSVPLTFTNILTYSEWSYIPEVVWQLDSSGIWVVVPASDPLSDPTQPSTLWYIPLSGSPSVVTTFISVPAFASSPVIAPDGNQVLYLGSDGLNNNLQVRRTDGFETGYTFAEAGQIGIVNWAPDSIHFTYWFPQPSITYIGAVGVVPFYVSDTSPTARMVNWIDDQRVIFISDAGELRFRQVDGASTLIDSNVSDYTFAFWIH